MLAKTIQCNHIKEGTMTFQGKIDLHCHTTASDGILSPSELVALAASEGLSMVAITDHDTLDGIDEAIAAGVQQGVQVIPGVELSLDYKEGTFHLVGLNIDYTHTILQQRLQWVRERRENRAVRMVQDLQDHGVEISMEDVVKKSDGGALGRPHVARVLLDLGLGGNLKDIFTRYLVKGTPGYVPKEKISVEEGFELILKAGGIPVLAHPVSLEKGYGEEFFTYVDSLIDLGLQGIEVYAAMHGDAIAASYFQYAHSRQLLVSGGSDYHGDKDERIGYYGENRLIPVGELSVLEFIDYLY